MSNKVGLSRLEINSSYCPKLMIVHTKFVHMEMGGIGVCISIGLVNVHSVDMIGAMGDNWFHSIVV